MNAFKRKSLYAAVVAGLGAVGVSIPAGAVNLGADGTGEVLLYPYYTTRTGFVTSFSVVNTSLDHTKVVKVRFLEGKNSAEVLDFNLFLSPRDVWVGSIADNGTGAQLTTPDRSCTAPAITGAVPFVNYYYTGATGIATAPADNAGTGLDRTREGYIEIIEMGVVADGADAASSPATVLGSNVSSAVRHNSAGTPPNCAGIRVNALFSPLPANGDLRTPVGGLTGNIIIINGGNGTEFATEPVPLQNFFFDAGNPGTNDLYTDPGSVRPNLSDALPDRSDVFVEGVAPAPAVITVASWAAAVPAGLPIDAVSAVLMRSAIMNEYDVSTNFKTDWVVTAPTKRFYVFPLVTAVGPFLQAFTGTAPNAQSCDTVLPLAFDREEAPYFVQAGVSFSPVPTGAPAGTGTLCWESTVMTVVPNGGTVAASSVFASANSASLTLPANGIGSPVAPNFTSGWIALFPTRGAAAIANGPGQGVAPFVNPVTGIPNVAITNDASGGLRGALAGGLRYRGLPVIGFAATQALIGGQGYGGIFDHKFRRSINAP